jgi:amino acid adenylation domain-containing protein
MPVVFTSALVLGGAGDDVSQGIRFFGEEVWAITQTPQVWLDHQVSEERGDLVFNWDAVPDLFPARMLDDMFGAYCELLDRLAADPDAWQKGQVARLPAWQRAERDAANATAADIASRTLGDLVEEQAALRPDAPAVLAHDGELTYRQTVVHARRLARRLRDLGAKTGELVAVVLDKGWEQVPAVLGVNLSGSAYLPIDPRWPQARREELLAQGRCRTVVTSAALRRELAWPVGVRTVTLADDKVRAASSERLETGPRPEDLAYVIFTSGSTGRPKGVMIDNRGVANTLQDVNARFGVGPQDRALGLSSLTFDLSVYDVFGMLAAGGAVVLPAPGTAHDPQAWAEPMARHGVTVWNSVPALMQAWTDAVARLPQPVPGKLRLALLSGDWIPVTLPDVVRTLHPGTEVISLGGATEGSIWSIHFPIGEVPPEWVRIPYGKALANQTMSVLNERLDPSPVWVTGEIFIGGVGVALGYWDDPERTAERFITHPVTGERLYRTGDVGRYLPGGVIEFLGRRDDQVKLNGYRIELGEIEAALLRQPGVAEAVAGLSQNPATGRRQLVAHVVAADAGGADAAHQDCAVPAPPTWRRAVEAGGAEVRRALKDLAGDLDAYRASWRGVEELCPLIMARTLASVGAFQAANATATAAEIAALAKAKSGYVPLIGQWLAVLADKGHLLPTGRPGEYERPEPLDASALDERIRSGFAELPVREDHRVLADYVAGCAEHQVELLRGTVSPLELLIGADSTAITEALYATNPVSHLQNRVAARVVRAFVERSAADRPLRILEVGAGTGATSALVLRDLPPGRAHYSFTDVSTYFTERAKRRFRDYVFVDYGIFDVDRDPAAQGVAHGSVDVVIAANVLHDAKDLGRTLRELRSALVPGGLLVAVEGTANSLVQMVSVGFIEGLGHHADQRELPLLEVDQWRGTLTDAGFARVAPVPEGEAAVDVHVQHVLLAGTADDTAGLDPAVLQKSLGELLPDYMVPHHILPVEQIPLSANGKVDRAALPVPWGGLAGPEPVAARDELETTLVGLWAEVLERDDFGVEDSFFELGGDSLHAVAILARLRDDFGLDLPADAGLELLFDRPTVTALAEVLRDRQGA